VRRGILVFATLACVAGCGNSDVLSPVEVAQNYVYAIAEGNYSRACGMLDQRTREALTASAGSRVSCPRLFARCLPKGSVALRHDQAQLLYANADLQVHGSRADVRLSGTAVASAAKEVTLIERRTQWQLTSAGRVITRCARGLSHHRRRGHRKRSAGG
jgi:hypothetical protein